MIKINHLIIGDPSRGKFIFIDNIPQAIRDGCITNKDLNDLCEAMRI